MLNKLTKEITIMKNFMNYICLFLMILGINVSANAATFTVTPNPIVINAELDDDVAEGEINVTYDIVGGMLLGGYYGYASITGEGDNKDDIIWDITGLESFALSPTGKGSFKITYETLDEGTYTATLNLWCYTSETGETIDDIDIPVTIKITTPQPQVDLTNYQTYCPRTVTFDLNGLPGEAPADIVTKKNLTITAPKDPVTPEGLTFIGWYNWEDDQRWNFATDVVTDDMILYAKCRSALTISGDVHLTSSKDVQVYTTPATNNMITVRWLGKDEPLATKIRFSYYLNDTKVEPTNSPFRVCDATSYNMIIDRVNNTGEDFEQTFAVSYKPTVYNQLDNYTIRVEAVNDAGTQIYRTADLAVYGRSLPEQFVIAMKNTNDNKWYALPNDLATSTSGSSSTKAPLLISVDNATAPTKALMAPKNTLYKGYSRYKATEYRNAIRFLRADATDNAWITTSSTSLLYMPDNNSDNQQFNLLSSDLAKYTITQDGKDGAIAMDGGIIGWYGSSNNTVYLLPVDASAEPAVFDVVEWFPTKLLIESSQDITTTSVQVGDAAAVVATASTTTYGTNLYEVQTGDLTAKAGQAMSVSYTIEATTYAKVVTVPIILSRGTYATSGSVFGGLSAKSNYKDNDLVVRDGATLTVDAATGTHNTFKNVTIYPTSKVVVPVMSSDGTKEVTMTTTTMTLFGGRDEIYDGSAYSMTTYAVPQLVLKGKLVHEATVQGLRYDMRLDDAIYYDFALPYQSKYEIVTDNKGGENFTYWIKLYDGDARAKGGTGWAWYNWDVQPWMINVGTGYLFAARPYTGQNFIIIRHPMGYNETTNPNGHQSGTPEGSKASVAVAAYPSTYDNNTGWNFIANPFLANFSKDDETNAVIKTGQLVEHKVNEKWDGHYEWNTSEGKDVRYVTTYNYATGHYYQQKMSEAVLPPFTGFFVQIANEGSVVFDLGGRADAAPARMLSDDELPSEIEVTLKVKGQSESDETVMLLTKDLSLADAREFPAEQTKMVNNGVLNYYTYAGDDIKMYANGMNYEEGQEWNKAGIMVKTAGEYTFSANGVNENYVEQVLLKDMDSNTEYDLMSNDAKIYLDKGEMNDRFYVKIVFGKHNIGTGITERYDTSAPEKFILNDHMYIRANGVLFDGVGKRVK